MPYHVTMKRTELKRTAFKKKPRKSTKTAAERENMSAVASLGCCVCMRLYGPHEPAAVELHHIRRGTGMGQRSSHMDVLPLCFNHHRGPEGIHTYGTKGFAKHYGFDEADLLDDVKSLLSA